MLSDTLSLGLDIGSTTAKACLRQGDRILFETYERHYSQVREKTAELLRRAQAFAGSRPVRVALSGSAGLGLAEASGISFVQEVFATAELVEHFAPDTACVIELGGEDAKIIFFDGGSVDERMNGSCAGGTGAFIDQMATLLDVSLAELDRLSLESTRLYPIASRCGVFAKTDIQPLLNQGANKADIAASIFQAVVNQTIAGLAQGRKISGKVMFLGGPLSFCRGLRRRFQETLKLDDESAVFPDYGPYAVARGAALYAERAGDEYNLADAIVRVEYARNVRLGERLPRLFSSEEELLAFRQRHAAAKVETEDADRYKGPAWLGIDCGSTTTKLALISQDKRLLYTYYASNRGDPVGIVREQLQEIYRRFGGRIDIRGSAVTGYGEELIQHAFHTDFGVVETIAHYTAAKFFRPDVDFILDIGGQDIKCFKIRNGAVDSIMLNEACSSGCGSFLETFEKSLGYSMEAFAELGLRAEAPVDLGSRCTVFMNSSVKQSQKDGASVADISAGLAISVVKNALYKVIRTSSPEDLGEHVVVQGGTFWNESVLRAFEMELGREVIRPNIAGLMGAYGAALYAMRASESHLLAPEELAAFRHETRSAVCGGCQNHCRLTVNLFADGGRYISGNQCERGLGLKKSAETAPNLYEFKRNALLSLPSGDGSRGTIGLPLALGMYELLPLWNEIFTRLGFRTAVSPMSTRSLYEKGQFSIPSDTACYPAKMMHGHIASLLEQGVDAIFYPCLTYNLLESGSDNHYNCPVVAYYAELLQGNVEELQKTRFLHPYLTLDSRKELALELGKCLRENGLGSFSKEELNAAVRAGFEAYYRHMDEIRIEGERILTWAREHGRRIMILAGRPYHIDAEISHGIDKLAASLGFAVVSEDAVCMLTEYPEHIRVLNQWTYHSRLYRAAKYATEHPDTELVQMVSFGCGVDAITTDEVRRILEEHGKLYTQLKIDEITNLGAVKIRLRSLLGALEERRDTLES